MMIWIFDKCRRSRLPAIVTLDELVCNPTVHASVTQYSYVRLFIGEHVYYRYEYIIIYYHLSNSKIYYNI